MVTRLKIFREPFTESGLRDLENDMNGFLRNIEDAFSSYAYVIYSDWIMVTIQYSVANPEITPVEVPEKFEITEEKENA
jgi:hypothetical protein